MLTRLCKCVYFTLSDYIIYIYTYMVEMFRQYYKHVNLVNPLAKYAYLQLYSYSEMVCLVYNRIVIIIIIRMGPR